MKVTPMTPASAATAPGSLAKITMNTLSTPLSNQGYAQGQEPLQSTNNSGGEETEPKVEATKELSPEMAQLAKQRRILQMKQKEIEAREKALSNPRDSAGGVDLDRLKSEPLSVLMENGITFEQLTEAILNSQGNSEISSLKSKIESLEKGIEQKFIEQNAQAEQQVLAEMRKEAHNLARSDEFELIREMRHVPDVMRLIEKTYRKTGEVLEVREAMSLFEAELLKDAQRITKFKKLSHMQTPQQQTPPQQRQYTGMRTLTNRDTASVPMSAKARAMAAFYGNLKR